MIILNILVLLAEALYFYIPLKEIKEIKSLKNKIKLYLFVFVSNIISTLICGKTIFKFILYPFMILISLKILNHNTRFYDFFLFVIEMLIKTFIEYIIYVIIFNHINQISFVIILEIISLIVIFTIKRKIKIIYYKFLKLWDNKLKFYFRYILLILFNIFIVFVLYNLIKIKEVT